MNPYYAAILAALIFFCGLAYERWNLRAELRGVEKLANWYARNLFRDTTAYYESLEKRLDEVETKMTETPFGSLNDRIDYLQDILHKHYTDLHVRMEKMIEENANG